MRLQKSKNAAEEELTALVNDGYSILSWLRSDYRDKRSSGTFDSSQDNQVYENRVNQWGSKVVLALNSIFPTELEANSFLNAPSAFGTVSGEEDYKWACLVKRVPEVIRSLERIIEVSLTRYTDLPFQARLYIEDIDSFRKVRDVNPSIVATLLDEGYLDLPEETVQMALEQILDVPLHKKDWGGERNDLYSANVIVNGARIATAFLLKGNGLRRKVMEEDIKDLGLFGREFWQQERNFIGNPGLKAMHRNTITTSQEPNQPGFALPRQCLFGSFQCGRIASCFIESNRGPEVFPQLFDL